MCGCALGPPSDPQVSGVEKDASKCRLRRVNMFDEALSEPCGNESISISKEGIINGTMVFLEDGVILSKVR